MTNHISHDSAIKQKDNSTVPIKTLGICLALIAAALVALFIFKVPVNTLFLAGALLACPLLHFWMMKGEHGRTMKDSQTKKG